MLFWQAAMLKLKSDGENSWAPLLPIMTQIWCKPCENLIWKVKFFLSLNNLWTKNTTTINSLAGCTSHLNHLMLSKWVCGTWAKRKGSVSRPCKISLTWCILTMLRLSKMKTSSPQETLEISMLTYSLSYMQMLSQAINLNGIRTLVSVKVFSITLHI